MLGQRDKQFTPGNCDPFHSGEKNTKELILLTADCVSKYEKQSGLFANHNIEADTVLKH